MPLYELVVALPNEQYMMVASEDKVDKSADNTFVVLKNFSEVSVYFDWVTVYVYSFLHIRLLCYSMLARAAEYPRRSNID